MRNKASSKQKLTCGVNQVIENGKCVCQFGGYGSNCDIPMAFYDVNKIFNTDFTSSTDIKRVYKITKDNVTQGIVYGGIIGNDNYYYVIYSTNIGNTINAATIAIKNKQIPDFTDFTSFDNFLKSNSTGKFNILNSPIMLPLCKNYFFNTPPDCKNLLYTSNSEILISFKQLNNNEVIITPITDVFKLKSEVIYGGLDKKSNLYKFQPFVSNIMSGNNKGYSIVIDPSKPNPLKSIDITNISTFTEFKSKIPNTLTVSELTLTVICNKTQKPPSGNNLCTDIKY
jgi:hypothetical protein